MEFSPWRSARSAFTSLRMPIYSHITSISCTCVACPQGAGRDAWHTYSPVSFRLTWETSKLLFEYILTLSGGSCRGSPLSAKRIPSLHHLTLVCTLSRHTPKCTSCRCERNREREMVSISTLKFSMWKNFQE